MLQISDKGKAVPASPIRKLVPYANKAKERGIRVFHLNIGQPDITTPKIALEVVRRLQILYRRTRHCFTMCRQRRYLQVRVRSADAVVELAMTVEAQGGTEAAGLADDLWAARTDIRNGRMAERRIRKEDA